MMRRYLSKLVYDAVLIALAITGLIYAITSHNGILLGAVICLSVIILFSRFVRYHRAKNDLAPSANAVWGAAFVLGTLTLGSVGVIVYVLLSIRPVVSAIIFAISCSFPGAFFFYLFYVSVCLALTGHAPKSNARAIRLFRRLREPLIRNR